MQWQSVAAAVLLFAVAQAAPTSTDEPRVLFTCPKESLCYASPPNCFDNCNAAFSISNPENFTSIYNITMMSPLSYTAVLIKELGKDKYDKAVICTLYAPRGQVVHVNYPDPVKLNPFIDVTEADGHTDTTYTQCSMNISENAPKKAKFKLISGKWRNDLILDENLAIDVVPAVEGAHVMSNSQRIDIPAPDLAAVRADEETSELDEKISEVKRSRGRKAEDDEEDLQPKKGGRKMMKGKDAKRGKKEKNGDDEDDEGERDAKKKKEEDEEEEQEIPRYKEYEDEEDEEHEEHDEDPDHASGLCVLTSLALSLLTIYRL
uniref:Expressed conserved protein n=1 Tax=Haemonchus contortus TaxID=6289 RepID=A0A7I4Y461_HAECO